MSRGSAVVEMLIGVLVAALLFQVVIAAGRVQVAGEQAAEAAAAAASWVARHGDTARAERIARALAPGAEAITLRSDGDEITVRVVIRVGLLGPDGVVTRIVAAEAVAPISPYRSRHG